MLHRLLLILLLCYGVEKIMSIEQWLWRSWQSSRFWHQRTRVQIQPTAIFIVHLLVNGLEKRTNKENEAGNGTFKKACVYCTRKICILLKSNSTFLIIYKFVKLVASDLRHDFSDWSLITKRCKNNLDCTIFLSLCVLLTYFRLFVSLFSHRLCFLNGPFPASLSLFSSFLQKVNRKYWFNKSCR